MSGYLFTSPEVNAVSLLHPGSPAGVAAYSRTMIEAAGEGGCYILDVRASLDGGRPEDLKTMVETARECGVY